jgi:hypothetical protein
LTISQPTPLAILELIDRLNRDPNGRHALDGGWDLYQAALADNVAPPGDADSVARCVGELVDDELVTYRSSAKPGGHPPRGVMWGSRELQEHLGYRPTPEGQSAASLYRQEQRSADARAVLDGHVMVDRHRWLKPDARNALVDQVQALEEMLLSRPAAAVGSAKDLVEAASKVVLEADGNAVRRREELPSLFRRAVEAAGSSEAQVPGARTLTRSMVAAAQGLAEMRNQVGTGHGQSQRSAADERHARLAAGLAATLTEYLLAGRD